MAVVSRRRYEELRAKWYSTVDALPPQEQYFGQYIIDFIGYLPRGDIKMGHLYLTEEASRRLNLIASPHFKTILKAYIIKQSS